MDIYDIIPHVYKKKKKNDIIPHLTPKLGSKIFSKNK